MNNELMPSNFKYQLPLKSGVVGARAVSPSTGANVNQSADSQGSSIVDLNGLVIKGIEVHLIFWGTEWAGQASPSTDEVIKAVQNILSGSYLSGLAQYRGIGNGTFLGTTFITSFNPPNPFSSDDVAQFVLKLISTSQVPKPEDDQQIWYCVIMPAGVACNQADLLGEHSYIMNVSIGFPIDIEISKVLYAWVTYNSTLDEITTVFSHELVETCTDPDGNGFQIPPPDPNAWHEIGDVCEGISDEVNGVYVQAYWSQADGVCVIPGLLGPSPGGAYPYDYQKE